MKKYIISTVSMLILMQSSVTIAQEPEKNAYIIEKFDNNHDNVVTQDEFLESAAKRFKTMDIDGDGAIEKEEILVKTKLSMPSRKLKVKISSELLQELDKMQVSFKLN